ncbi:MAG TPA: cytochrome c biogenesis protein CcsA [Gemmataceae bacterium]|jgi:hypothetical protein|nr:cytochrome c biogenesis protein CcsA [Gemmataceae bacterium]
MFDLEARIRQWRQSLIGRLGQGDALDELESHLREVMHRAALAGREPEAAWNDAVARLGTADGLAREFAKVPAVRPMRSISAWCIFVTYLLVPAAFVCPMLAKIRQTDDSALLLTHVATICAGYFAVLAFGVQASLLTLSRLWGGATMPQLVVLRWWGRVYFAIGLVGCLVGFVLGAIWTRERYGYYWSNDAKEIGGVVMVAWTLAMSIRFSRGASPSLVDLALGVAGNPVTMLSWFGAAYVSSQGWLTASFAKSTTFPPFLFVFMIAFFAIHGVLLCLTVVPLPRRGAAPMESNR